MKKTIFKFIAIALAMISLASLTSCGGLITFPIAVKTVTSNFGIEDGVYYTSDFSEPTFVVIKGSKMYAIPDMSHYSFACHIEFGFFRAFDTIRVDYKDAEIYDTAISEEGVEATDISVEDNDYAQNFITRFVERTNGMKYVELESGFLLGSCCFVRIETN